MPDNTNIIKKIRVVDNDNSYTESIIGSNAEYVDYNGSTVKQKLDELNQQVIQLRNAVNNSMQIINEMQETFGTAQRAINKINHLKTSIQEIPSKIELQIQKKMNSKIFYTKDIYWQPGIQRSLRSVLGNLVNLPLEAVDLRDWMEKNSNNLNDSNSFSENT